MTIITTEVERIAHTGEGIATHEGRTLLVDGALPGERVRAQVTHVGKVSRGAVVEVLVASEARVDPPCAHFAKCGGCNLMHASAALQRQTRRNAAMDLLGAVRDNLVEPVVHTPSPPLGYRSRARLTIHGDGTNTQVGFHRARSHKLAAIDGCVVLQPELQPCVALLRELVQGSRGTGDARVTLTPSGAIVVELRWDGQLQPGVFERANQFVTRGDLAGVRVWEGKAAAPATFGDARGGMTAADGLPLWVAPGGFAQASEEGARLLAARVGALAAMRPGGLTIELFAGSGTLTVAALPAAERYIAVERDEPAVAMLRENLEARGLTAKCVVADAETYALRRPLATVILDPPRTGAAKACERIAAARPRQIIYVSCNPSTLARDLTILADYRLQQLELVELFPQTSHLEVIARLTR